MNNAFGSNPGNCCGGNRAAATAIKKAADAGSCVAAAWESQNMPKLVKLLAPSVNAPPDWDTNDYDTIYVVDAAAGTWTKAALTGRLNNYPTADYVATATKKFDEGVGCATSMLAAFALQDFVDTVPGLQKALQGLQLRL